MFPVLKFTEGGWCPELGVSYAPGYRHAKTREEYEALAPHAVDAQKLEPEPPVEEPTPKSPVPASAQRDKATLCAWAKENAGLDLDPESGSKAELMAQIEAALAAKP